MARYSAACRTSAGSTTLPIISLYNSASVNGQIVEIGAFNTTTTAVALKVVRLSTTGTQGSALTEVTWDTVGATSNCQAFNTHSANPTITAGDIVQATLGAAAGSGVIWTFGSRGLSTGLAGTGNGVGIVVATGSGQVCDCWIVWDE